MLSLMPPGRQSKLKVKVYVTEQAKKARSCPHCGYLNGTVKKLTTGFKIVHVFDAKNKRAEEERENQMKEFDNAVAHNGLMESHVKKPVFELDPLVCKRLLEAIPDEDCAFLGFDKDVCRPEDMITSVLPVPPVCIRPSVQRGFSGSNEDDLTVALGQYP